MDTPLEYHLTGDAIGGLDAVTAARLMSAVSDVVIVTDRDGVICDVAVSGPDMSKEDFADIINRPWVETVGVDSRHKVEEILLDVRSGRDARWREINLQLQAGSIPLSCLGIGAGRDGRVIVIGRDLRADHALQQRVLQAQQAMERDYIRLRQAESRYRVLFQITSEALLIVDPASKKIIEANPALGAMLGVDCRSLVGQSYAKLFHPETRDGVRALLSDQNATARTDPLAVRLADGRDGYKAVVSLFRQDGELHGLICLSATKEVSPASEDESKRHLLQVLNRVPDAFVVADEALNIVDVNLSFLELLQLASAEAAKGQPLGRFLGRPGVDLRVLAGNLRDHGTVRNFGTVVRTVYGEQSEVELSAVSVRIGLESCHGFVIRPARRVAPPPSADVEQLPRTAAELTHLVGRSSLREIVTETTDVIERMCIKAALELTGNNRAAAAEMLGLSRQSLYSKLSRFGLGSAESSAAQDI